MADRLDYFFRQKVTEAELDLAFELLERADRNLAADIGVYGIVSGAEPAPHSPVPDLTIDLTAPGRAYDNLGQRIFFGTGQIVDCAVDFAGIPTEVPSAGQERWLGIFLKFERLLSDPRTDGHSQQIYFRRDESFDIVVRQAPPGPVGSAGKVALQPDELLICDVRRSNGQTQILGPDIDTSRRQAFIFAQGDAVQVLSGTWTTLDPAVDTVQSSFDEVDAELTDHFTGAARRHGAGDIDIPAHGFVSSTNVEGAIHELVDDLSATASGTPGAQKVGADAVPGTPNALPAGTVDGQLSQLLAWLNAHLGAAAGAHNASAIAAAAHNHIAATSVQAQLEEIVDDLEATAAARGASLVGNAAVSGSPQALTAGTVRQHISTLLSRLNSHINGGDHDARYYNVGDQVDDADTVDGQHASAFALAGHNHDTRYMRRVYLQSEVFTAGQSRLMTTLEERPDLITVSYNYMSGGAPQATTYIRGALTPDIRAWVTKQTVNNDKDYQLSVQNLSSSELYINVAAYRVGT